MTVVEICPALPGDVPTLKQAGASITCVNGILADLPRQRRVLWMGGLRVRLGRLS